MRRVLIFALIFLIALITSFPYLLSSAPGNRFLRKTLAKKLALTIPTADFFITWLGPQKVERLTFKKELFTGSIESLSLDNTLFSLIFNPHLKGEIRSFFIKDLQNQIEVNSCNFAPQMLSTTGRSERLGQIGSFNATYQMAPFEMRLKAQNFPLDFALKAVNSLYKPLPSIALGELLTLDATSRGGELMLDVQSELFKLHAEGRDEITARLEMETLSLSPLIIHWQEGLSLQAPITFEYHPKTRSPIKGEISEFRFPKDKEDPLRFSATLEGITLTGGIAELSIIGDQGHWKGSLSSPLLTAKTSGSYSSEEWKSGLTSFTYRVTPQGFDALLELPELHLQEECTLTGEIAPLAFFSTPKLDLSLKSTPLTLIDKQSRPLITLTSPTLAAFWNVDEKKISARVNSKTLTEGGDGTIKLNAERNGEGQPELSLDFNGDKLPTALLNALISPNYQWPQVVGNWATLSTHMRLSPRKRHLTVKGQSEYLTLSGNFDFTKALRLDGEAFASLKIEPHPIGDLSWESKSGMHFEIAELYWPLISDSTALWPKLSPELDKVKLQIHLLADAIKLRRGSDLVTLDKINFDLIKLSEMPALNCEGGLRLSDGKSQGDLKCISLITSKKGPTLLQSLSAQTQAKLTKLPTPALDQLLLLIKSQTRPFTALFGSELSGNLEGTFSAKESLFEAEIDSNQLKGKTTADVVGGILQLKEPLRASLNFTPELSERLFKNSDFKLLSTDKPILLQIDNRGFSLPIWPYDISQLQAPSITLDIGKAFAENVGTSLALSLILKLPPSNRLFLWFAPSRIRARSGILSIERTEALMSASHTFNAGLDLATWGEVDLNRKRLNMILGITAQALQTTLGIGGLQPQYVLKVPMKGPFGHVKVESDKAIAKLALLVARKQIKPHAGGWGDVIDAIGGLTDDQSDVPPPKRPFPWEKNL